MPEVVTVGEILVEVMAEGRGQDFLKPATLTGPYPSGAPAIFIDQAARMGVECGIIARVGEDNFAELNIKRLKEDNVDVSNVIYTPGYTTGTAFVTYLADGSRSFIFHFTHSAAGQLEPEDVQESYFQNTKYLHIMGCSLSGSKSMREAILKAVEICSKQDTRISFDPNIRPELLGVGEFREIFDRILSVSDIVLTGEEEIKQLFARKSSQEIVQLLKSRGNSIIVFKNGARETKAFVDKQCFIQQPFVVNEVDPTGAGDCFDGAFIASLLQGKSIQESLEIACGAGALAVSKKGPMEGAAKREEILEFITKMKKAE